MAAEAPGCVLHKGVRGAVEGDGAAVLAEADVAVVKSAIQGLLPVPSGLRTRTRQGTGSLGCSNERKEQERLLCAATGS